MIIREANKSDLNEILQLYLYLHEERVPENSEHLRNTLLQIPSRDDGEIRSTGFTRHCRRYSV